MTEYNPLADPYADPDPPEEPAPVPASMSMTKAELLERLHAAESDLTKAEILERIKVLEAGEGDAKPEPSAATMAADLPAPETRSATIDGVTRTWTADTEDQVPEAYRDIYAQAKAAGG